MPSPACTPESLESIRRKREELGQAWKRWVLTDPVKTQAQFQKNRLHREALEKTVLPPASYNR